MMIVSFRRLALLSCLFSTLPSCFSETAVDGSGLRSLWDIKGPDGRTCLAEGESTNICDGESSVIRMDYIIHKNVKVAKYQILQKECEEKFEAGAAPIEGIVSSDDDDYAALSISDPSDDVDTVTASIELRAQQDYLSSPWWRRMSSTEKQQQSVDFCVEMSTWLPPDAGDMMVNFRETNVNVLFNRKEGVDGEEFFVSGVVLEAKPLQSITIKVGASTGKQENGDEVDSNEGSGNQNNDEL